MFSLKNKIILSLIGMSLFAISLGALTSRWLMLSEFETLIYQRATFDYSREVVAYFNAYGSWDAANNAETFYQYTDRQRNPARLGLARGNSEQRPLQQRPNQRTDVARSDTPAGEVGARVAQFAVYGGRPPPFNVADMDGIVRIAPLDGPNQQTDVDFIAGRAAMGVQLSEAQLARSTPLMNGEQQIGWVLPAGRAELSELEQQILSALQHSWWYAAALVMLAAVPLGLWQGHRLIAPIHRLNNALKTVRPGNIAQHVVVDSKDEIGEMSQNFNRMTHSLAAFVDVIQTQKQKIIEAEQLRKEGIASISHELMTPLNSTVAQVAAMTDGIRPSSPKQLNQLGDSLDHLTKLVGDMFQLSLADVNALECHRDTIDLSTLVADALDFKAPAFTAKNFQLDTQIPEQFHAIGDATRMRQVIDNLLENTAKYAHSGAAVKVVLERHEDQAILVVSDNGPGVSADRLDRLFDRFYREESSRNRDTGGSGLGLSLVKAWIEAQGGKVAAYLSPEGGLAIRVSVPAA